MGDVLKNINLGKNGTAFIVNQNGELIAHKDKNKVLAKEKILSITGTSDQAHAILDLVSHRQTGADRLQSPQGDIYFSYAPIRGTFWALGIESPRSDFSTNVERGIFFSIFTLAVALFAAVIIFRNNLQRILARPLYAITNSASELARGEFANKLSPALTGRTDEIGSLGTAFTSMSHSVQCMLDDIEKLTLSTHAGNFYARANSDEHKGDFHLILDGINTTLSIVCAHLDAMPSALAFFNETMAPAFLNSMMRTVLMRHSHQLDQEHLLASLLSSGTSTRLPEEVNRLFTADVPTDTVYSVDVEMRDSHGTAFHYMLTLRCVGNDAGAVGERKNSCVALILSDITVLTQALLEAENARSEAEAASRSKSDFLSNMSHEMRTPMNAIIGMSTIAKAANDTEKKDYCLARIDDASNHLLGVINDVLDMSKIEANKFELSPTEFHFEKMLQNVINVIHFRIDEKNLNFSVHLDENIPSLLVGDDQRLAQVIANLLSNAVKFTPEGGMIRLNAQLKEKKNNLCILQIEVSDTGIGITQENHAKLFQSFEQAENSTSRRFGGTGLGLAISKRIVEMMHGRIWVNSTLGEGSVFSFTVELECASSDASASRTFHTDWKKIRILMVDDLRDAREYFAEVARQLGLTCDTASGGQQALKMLETNEPYDLYFIDWKMPEMDGIELSSRIKKRAGNTSIVIMISSNDWSLVETDAKKAGVDQFLTKPLFATALSDCITKYLGQSSAETPPAEVQIQDESFAEYTILLAEDVEINREILLSLLAPTHINIDCAENGAKALALFSAAPEKYDAIFMDLQMPEMDGLEAARRIRALAAPEASQIPIIAMTANVFREDVENCLAAGMNAHVGKPLNLEEVFSTLRRFLPTMRAFRDSH